MSRVHAFPMNMYSLFNILFIFALLGTFLIVFLSLPLFLFTLVVSMAFKRKSTPTRNPLYFGASSSFDSAPLSLFGFVMMMPTRHSWRTFLDEVFIQNAKSFWRTSPIDLPIVIHSQEWESPYDVPITCPFVLIQEFYSNLHGIDRSVPLFFTRIRGMCILVTP